MNKPAYSLHLGKNRYKDIRDVVIVREWHPTYEESSQICNPVTFAQYVYNMFKHEDDVEYFLAIPLNNANIPLGFHILAKGTVNEVLINPRDVFRAAIMLNATSVLLAHTHPSGNNMPSENDHKITKSLIAAGNTLGIKVLDHVVVGMGECMSYFSIETGVSGKDSPSRFTVLEQ